MSLQRIVEVKSQQKDLRLFFIDKMGSDLLANNRLRLRETLQMLLTQQHLSSPSSILNLSQSPPQHPEVNISLSHSPSASMVGWCAKSLRLGVDLEEVQRPTLKTISRIATPQEIQRAPHFSYLWSAKEAAFKCLSPQYKVLSSVEIVDWKPLDASSWTFALDSKTGEHGYGELHLIMEHTLAFFTSGS